MRPGRRKTAEAVDTAAMAVAAARPGAGNKAEFGGRGNAPFLNAPPLAGRLSLPVLRPCPPGFTRRGAVGIPQTPAREPSAKVYAALAFSFAASACFALAAVRRSTPLFRSAVTLSRLIG